MKFCDVKVRDKVTWVTEGTTWINGQPQKRLLKYPAQVVEVFETIFICRTTDVYYLYSCNKSDGVAVGHGRECGWTEKVKTLSLREVKLFKAVKNPLIPVTLRTTPNRWEQMSVGVKHESKSRSRYPLWR